MLKILKLTLGFFIVVLSSPARADIDWLSYQHVPLDDVIKTHAPHFKAGDIDKQFSGAPFKFTSRVIYTGKTREISAEKLQFLQMWGKTLQISAEFIAQYKQEILVKTKQQELWIPMQSMVLNFMARELKPGDTYYLYYIMNGMLKKEWVFTAVEFQRIHLSSHDLNNPTLVDHFRSREDQLICITGKTDPNACSHIGPFKIGAPYKAMDNPWKEIAQNNGVTVTAYPIINNDKHNAYWVIGHKAGTITSLQLTGNYADDKLSFSSIKLDDSQDKVKSILGPRYRVKQLQDINGEMWDYYPFPISIEFVKGKVYSIRVTETNNP